MVKMYALYTSGSKLFRSFNTGCSWSVDGSVVMDLMDRSAKVSSFVSTNTDGLSPVLRFTLSLSFSSNVFRIIDRILGENAGFCAVEYSSSFSNMPHYDCNEK